MTLMAGISPGAGEWLERARMMRREQLSKLAQLGVLVHGISQLVHMLQCERGASNVWLCSQGKLYAPECKASRALVDENLAALYDILEKQSPIPGSTVCERIGGALLSLDMLPALRDGVIQQTVTAPQAMEHYSRMLRHLLSIVPQLNDSIDDPPVAGRMVALYSFMQGKELVGQERALGALGFTRGEFSDSLRQQLVDRIDGQQPCFDSFQALGSPATVQLFRTQCHAGLDIEQLRRIACTRQPAADGGETALRWFGLQTQRLEQLREVEEQLIDDLLDATDALLADDAPGWQAGEEDDSVTPRLDKQLLPLVRQQAYELQQLSSQLASLKDALEERKLIEKAKSLLMTHQGMQEEQAWQTLRKMAMDKNQRMVEIARALLMVKAIWPLTPKE